MVALSFFLMICSLGSVFTQDTAGTLTASSTLADSTSMIASSLNSASTAIAASLSVEAASATSLAKTTSATSSYADSTTSAASSMHGATTSAASTIADSTTSAASSLGEPTTASTYNAATSTANAASSTSGSAVPPFTSPCANLGLGSGCKDPHFVGFDGSVYDFHGRFNTVFALITDSMFEVNALFSEFTDGWTKWKKNGAAQSWMTEIGIRCFNHSVVISQPKNMAVSINNTEMSSMKADFYASRSSVDIQCGSYWSVTVSREYDRWSGGANLKLHTTVLSLPEHAPHGILGQTLRYKYVGDQLPHPVRGQGDQGKGVVEGEVADYEVRAGILGADSKVNRFLGSADLLEVENSKRSEPETSFRMVATAF